MRNIAGRTKLVSLLVASAAALSLGLSSCSGDDAKDAESSAGASESPADDAAAEPDLTGIPDVVAVVNGEEISKEQFVETYTNQFTQQSQQAAAGGTPVDEDALKQQTLDSLVDRTLLVSAADERGFKASKKDVDDTLTKMAESNGLGTAEEFLTALEEQGMAEDEVRSELELQVRVEKLVAEEAGGLEPTRKEIRKYYDDLVAQQESSGSEEAAEIPPLKEVRTQIADQLTAQNESEAIGVLLESLREDATIERNL